MGGVSDRDVDGDAELVYRGHCEGRDIIAAPDVTVDSQMEYATAAVGSALGYRSGTGVLRRYAKGFPLEHIECDVVLPFFGHLDYLDDALTSVLEQENADVVIHLLDDASPVPTDDVLRRWSNHPRIRVYRNVRNLGPYTSFNNIFPYFETRLVAIQDADDISRPDRMHLSGNMLRLTNAGIFGAASRHFQDSSASPGEGDVPSSAGRMPQVNQDSYSRFPRPGVGWFLANPTAMMDVGIFGALGGFADYGHHVRNKCGLDTEFYLRAYYAGARFAISREFLIDYRRHADQATQNLHTGWGTELRSWSIAERSRRQQLYKKGRFDPVAFGALGRYSRLTRRLDVNGL